MNKEVDEEEESVTVLVGFFWAFLGWIDVFLG